MDLLSNGRCCRYIVAGVLVGLLHLTKGENDMPELYENELVPTKEGGLFRSHSNHLVLGEPCNYVIAAVAHFDLEHICLYARNLVACE